jgi:hypothetical protein
MEQKLCWWGMLWWQPFYLILATFDDIDVRAQIRNRAVLSQPFGCDVYIYLVVMYITLTRDIISPYLAWTFSS